MGDRARKEGRESVRKLTKIHENIQCGLPSLIKRGNKKDILDKLTENSAVGHIKEPVPWNQDHQ